MSEPITTAPVVVAMTAGGFAAFFAGLNPELATASIFGAFMFLAMSVRLKWFARICLLVFSIGCGYVFGSLAQDYYPEGKVPMVVALFVGAIGAVAFSGVYQYVDGGPRPAWLDWVCEKIPFLKSNKSPTDGGTDANKL